MRGLNLSRLAARGAASEKSFFRDQQAAQAEKLRSKLSPSELEAAASKPDTPTVDTLSEISAHKAYRTLLRTRPEAPQPAHPRPLLSALARTTSMPAQPRQPDPPVLRALGSSRLHLFQSLPSASAKERPLPGSSRYADGAALGIGAFAVATGLVAFVGAAGGVYLYFRPDAVDRMRERSLGLRHSLDEAIGQRLRGFRSRFESGGPLLSQQAEQRARWIAESAVKAKPARGESAEDRESPADT